MNPPKNKRHAKMLGLIALVLIIFGLLTLSINLINNNPPNSPLNEKPKNTVVKIIDGDTFELASGEIIRLLCVDTPELPSEAGEESKDFLFYSIYDREVLLNTTGKDKYNRTLAFVYYDNLLINKEIIDKDYGSLFEYNNTDCEKVK